MKIERFYVADYRVLRDLDMDFVRESDQRPAVTAGRGYALDFLAGVNGTGKTTALQLLGKLFAWLEQRDYFPVQIYLSYTLGQGVKDGPARQVKVTNMPEQHSLDTDGTGSQLGKQQLYYRVTGEDWKKGKLDAELLPQHVVIYATGSETEWREAVRVDDDRNGPTAARAMAEQDTEPYLHELPGHRPDLAPFEEDVPLPDLNPRLLFIQAERLPLVTLCGLLASRKYADKGKEPLASVLDAVDIGSLEGFSLRLRAHLRLTPLPQQATISDLEGAAERVLQQGSDRLLLFRLTPVAGTQNKTPAILDLYDSPIDLFQRLNSLCESRPFYDPPLQEVNLFLRPRKKGDKSRASDGTPLTSGKAMLHLFDWLSDGERSFLGRMALFTLFRENDLLILLDEPEVHFNDVWKREIVNMLDEIMRGHASHAVISTHSSIALTDVPPEDILVFRRLGEHTGGPGAVLGPGIETFGADPSDIMVHVFGTVSASGSHSSLFIRKEIGKRRTVQELQDLERAVAPGYWRYRIQLETQRLEGHLH